MSSSTFQKRFLAVEINVPASIKKMNYQTGQLEASSLAGQRISLQNYRISAAVECYGQTSAVQASFQIYNLPDALMRGLSGYGTQGVFNYAASSAADIASGNGVVTVSLFRSENTNNTLGKSASQEQLMANQKNRMFRGSLVNASAKPQAAPDPFLFIQCYTMNDAMTVPTPAISFKGGVKAADIAQQIAAFMGWGFENAGVQTVLQNPYFSGSTSNQLNDLAQQGLFVWTVENQVLSIWPINGERNPGDSGILISADTGLIGYPEFNGIGVTFRVVYQPGLRYGDKIRLKTAAPNASGSYVIYGLSHHVDSELPEGEWYSIVQASFVHSKIGQAMDWTPNVG